MTASVSYASSYTPVANISKARVYFTGPADSTTGVLFLTDIFGVDFINSQLVADSFGAQG